MWAGSLFFAALLIFAMGWYSVILYATGAEPSGNRAYAQTWVGAPLSELIETQGKPDLFTAKPSGEPGQIASYHFGGWRGMKGRTYPGNEVLASISGQRYMESGIHFYTAPDFTYCDIGFWSAADGTIGKITYSGNDCD